MARKLACGLKFNRTVNHAALINQPALIGEKRESARIRRIAQRKLIALTVGGGDKAQHPTRGDFWPRRQVQSLKRSRRFLQAVNLARPKQFVPRRVSSVAVFVT